MSKEDGNGNLIPFNQRTEDEQRAIASKGGKASGRSRREKRTYRQILEERLSGKITNTKTNEVVSRKDAMGCTLIEKGLKGDLRAIELILKILGEWSGDKVELSGKVDTNLIAPRRLSSDEVKELLKDMDKDY